MPQQRLYEYSDVFTVPFDPTGFYELDFTLTFRPPPSGLVWEGSVTVRNAAQHAQIDLFLSGNYVGTFYGPGPYGPIQILPGDILTARVSYITYEPEATFQGLFVGKSYSLAELNYLPIQPVPTFPSTTFLGFFRLDVSCPVNTTTTAFIVRAEQIYVLDTFCFSDSADSAPHTSQIDILDDGDRVALHRTDAAQNYEGMLVFPGNLYLLGTVTVVLSNWDAAPSPMRASFNMRRFVRPAGGQNYT